MSLVEIATIGGALLTFAIIVLKIVAPKTKTEADDEALTVLQKIKAFVNKRKTK